MGDVVVDQLRSAILSGALRPGSRIKQEALADQLGVSRAPVRQALLVLEREGLIKSGVTGAIVAPVDRTMIVDLYAFRGIIESYVASTLAAQRDFNPKRHNRVVGAGRRAALAGDVSRLIELDLEFHTGLYKRRRQPCLVRRDAWINGLICGGSWRSPSPSGASQSNLVRARDHYGSHHRARPRRGRSRGGRSHARRLPDPSRESCRRNRCGPTHRPRLA